MASLIEAAENGTLTFTWRGVGKDMCTEGGGTIGGGCANRHGMGGFTLDEWQAHGLPGDGQTVCRGYCRCTMLPDSLLSVEVEFKPFSIEGAVSATGVRDPIEAARIAANIVLVEDFPAGQRVRYDGPIREVRGAVAVVRAGVNPEDGLWLDFVSPNRRFPEFASLHISDFTELVQIGGG